MSNSKPTPDVVRLLAEQAGLQRALKMFPDGVTAAVERGLRPLPTQAGADISPISTPASIFNPASFESSK
jgi:hypothetical protein